MPPAAGLVLTGRAFTAGTQFTRIASDALGASEPSDSTMPRRFSPVRDNRGRVVPVLYAGENLECALGETVFHDLDDDTAHAQFVYRADLLTQRRSVLLLNRDILMADLTDDELTRLHVPREGIIATTTTDADYAITRLWAQHVWDHTRFAGLVWNSRRSHHLLSVVLFIGSTARSVARRTDIDVIAAPVSLYDGPGFTEVQHAASARNVGVII